MTYYDLTTNLNHRVQEMNLKAEPKFVEKQVKINEMGQIIASET